MRCALVWIVAAAAARAQSIAPELLKESTARSIGPAATGGRIVDVAVHPDRPWTIYAASASGGLWKSENNGTTWRCVFEQALSIGAVAVAPSEPDVVWLATGEGNNQRSSYAGNGVWRSSDGGRNWTHCGLEETHHVGRVAVDPSDANVAYVAALGHLYTRNDERGLYKTSDGGASWSCVLHLDDATGVADVVVDPRQPQTVYATSYGRQRRAWNFDDVGDHGIYKSVDGGTSWRRLSGGLPSGRLGRIGLALFPDDPNRLYACIDNQNTAPPENPSNSSGEKPDAAKVVGGEVWRTLDGGATWERRNTKPVRGEPPYYYGQVRVDPFDPEHVWLLGVVLFVSKDGGKTFSEGEVGRSLHGDHHALWFDPQRRGRLLEGNDGGLAQSYDGGASFDGFENLPVAQFYTVSVDRRRPYRVYGGLQDCGIWSGPSRSRAFFGASNGEWHFLGGGDGMYVLADPKEPDVVYYEAQFGSLTRTDLRTHETKGVQPPPSVKDQRDRYNWCSPLVVSSHNSQVLYFGAQCLWKSLDRGEHWKPVSGDLTTHDAERLKGNVPHCTITTIAESTLDPDLLLVGTDDGQVQWTDDGGRSWTSVAGRFPQLPEGRWCSRVELSHHDRKDAWVAFTGYREDDFEPDVFRTRDGGKSFERVTDGLPAAPVSVVRESPRRDGVLFLGGDGGAFFSLDGGDHWNRLVRELPTVSLLDLAVHPLEREVVLASHGRGMFVVDVAAIEQLDAKVLASDAFLFEPAVATQWRPGGGFGGWSGDRKFRAPNPESGATLWYWLGEKQQGVKPKFELFDAKGQVVQTFDGGEGLGLHRVVWDLRVAEKKSETPPQSKDEKRKPRRYEPGDDEEEEEQEELEREFGLPFSPDGGARGHARDGGGVAAPGAYVVRMRVGDATFERELEVVADDGAGD
jgi:photosystem II stability/assembly factor-like uncharacterized protein